MTHNNEEVRRARRAFPGCARDGDSRTRPDRKCRARIERTSRHLTEEAFIAGDTSEIRVTRGQQLFASWVMDVLVFIVVLNLFVEYLPKVITESFTISIFTAVVLKLLIDAIAGLEHHVSGWFKRREGSGWRLLGLVTIVAILFFSKFIVLEVIDIVFGDRVTLGGFLEVLVLVLTMILARLGLTWTYRRLGEQGSP